MKDSLCRGTQIKKEALQFQSARSEKWKFHTACIFRKWRIGLGREAKRFYARLAKMIAENRDVPVSIGSFFMRTKIKFSLLKSTLLLCIRGSRSLKKMNVDDIKDLDIDLTNKMSNIEIE